MKKTNFVYLFLAFLLAIQGIQSQDLLDKLNQEIPDKPIYTQATFKSNRILFGHSIETRKKGVLDFNVNVKFWNMPDSQTQNFGSDFATTRFGIDYAFSDRFATGFGASTFDGIFNTYGKYRLVRQKDSDKKAPFGITLLQSISYQTRNFNHIDLQSSGSDRFSFASQVIIARKFDSNLSFQIAPTFVRRNSAQFEDISSGNHFALGFGIRYRVARHVAIASEYYYVANPIEVPDGHLEFFGPFAIGVNWDIRNVLVQFSLTNTRSFDDATTIVNTFNNFNFNNGNLHIGVSLTYAFHLKKRKL